MQINWEKLGLIYKANGNNGWDLNSALTPTPFVFEDKVRIYAGFRDVNGVSRIGYVDLDKKNPLNIIAVSEKPVLDIGEPGTFDDNGVILGDVILIDDKIHMYYVGFQLVNKVKFLAYTGLAISDDNGETFVKQSNVPVLDRRENSLYFNAVHSVILEKNKYKFWLGAGSSWQLINGIQYPSYNVKFIESENGIDFLNNSVDCLSFSSKDEYRIGRPRVYLRKDSYIMIFTWGDTNSNYQMGYAESKDGINWVRNDSILNFKPSVIGWDSKSTSYGALFEIDSKTYMVYNGNDMGKEGFGLAVIIN